MEVRSVVLPLGPLQVSVDLTGDEATKGHFVGDIAPGSPARGRLFVGDRILSVDDTDVRSLSNVQLRDVMIHRQHKHRTLTVARPSVDEHDACKGPLENLDAIFRRGLDRAAETIISLLLDRPLPKMASFEESRKGKTTLVLVPEEGTSIDDLGFDDLLLVDGVPVLDCDPAASSTTLRPNSLLRFFTPSSRHDDDDQNGDDEAMILSSSEEHRRLHDVAQLFAVSMGTTTRPHLQPDVENHLKTILARAASHLLDQHLDPLSWSLS